MANQTMQDMCTFGTFAGPHNSLALQGLRAEVVTCAVTRGAGVGLYILMAQR